MYCTNSQKPTILHVLLADVVEMCGGSRTLIKILNQLGVAASADTHDRFVTCVSEKQREKSIWESLPENTFSIASVDNFDMLQSHAAVYCGDQQRSYHGTTIQLVQPDPSLILRYPMSNLNGDHLCTVCDAVFRPTQCKRKSSHTPSSSPHKLGKVGPKRPRTLVVRDLTKSVVQANDTLSISSITLNSGFTLGGFLDQPEEKKERKDFESKLFSYMFAQHKLPARLVLKDFKTLYSENKCKDNGSSNIYYMVQPSQVCIALIRPNHWAASVAQWLEQLSSKQCVVGSNPTRAALFSFRRKKSCLG